MLDVHWTIETVSCEADDINDVKDLCLSCDRAHAGVDVYNNNHCVHFRVSISL